MRVKLGCLVLLVLAITGCSKQQEVVFEAESIGYKGGAAEPKTEEECIALSKELKGYLNDGWKVVASSPKEKVVADGYGKCIGTEYVLEK
jgi:hypothetical protein